MTSSSKGENPLPRLIVDSSPDKQEEMAPLAAPEIASMDSLGDKLQESNNEEPTVEPSNLPLSKEEVMKFANDPFWIKLRWCLFALFWIFWTAILILSIVIIILAPKCPTPKPKDWWQRAPIYEVYVKSFKDSDGDGIGDLKGITTKLDYLKTLGVESINLSPIFESPFENEGYDIQTFEAVNPIFGTIQDFKDLLHGLHAKGMKIILDFVLNHSSDKHAWFQKSIKKEGRFADYYVWKNGDAPPNNWLMRNGDPAWSYNEERGEWYLHQIGSSEPDLNLRNPNVVKEVLDILKFWLDLGVDGFRFKYTQYLFESESLEDEKEITDELDYSSLNHTETFDLEENLKFLKDIRKLLDKKTAEDEANPSCKRNDGEEIAPRIMMTDVSSSSLFKYYGVNGSLSHIPINFISLQYPLNATDIYNSIVPYMAQVKKIPGAWPNFAIDGLATSRLASRFGTEAIDLLHMIYILLPATPLTYYGEELGMLDLEAESKSDLVVKSPMIWSKEEGAGFTYNASVTPWIRIMDGYEDLNVKCQIDDPDSHYAIYKALSKLRLGDAILQGEFNSEVMAGDVIMFTVVKKGNPGVLVIANFGDEESDSDLSKAKFIPEGGSVLFGTNASLVDNSETNRVDFKSVKLSPKTGLVVSFVANFKTE